jgi:parallel beta-helix repeat protein
MADVYVADPVRGAEDGTTADDAFLFSSVNWGGLSAGDTVWFIGDMTVTVINPNATTGTAANPIVLRGDVPNELPGHITASSTSCVSINSDNYITVKNLWLSGGTTAVVFVGGTSVGAIIEGCTLDTSTDDRIIWVSSAQASPAIIRNNTLNHLLASSGSASRGIDCTGGGTGLTITGNTLNGNLTFNTNSNHAGIYMDDFDSNTVTGNTIQNWYSGLRIEDANSNLFEGNIFIDNGDASAGQHAVFSLTGTGNVFTRNTLTGGRQGVVTTATGGGNEISSNLISGYIVNGISYQGNSATHDLVVNNTVIHTPTADAGHGIVVQLGGASTSVRIKNNLVTCSVTGSNVQCIAIAGTRLQVDIDYNSYYVTNGAVIGNLDTGTDRTTLAAWQTDLQGDALAIGEDANSLEADPALDAGNVTTLAAAMVGGTKWWTDPPPVGNDGEPFPRWEISMGANQSQAVPSHPTNL